MPIINVVKVEMADWEICKKFPTDDLRLGSQLVVYPTQVAFFVKGGQIFDQFDAGTYTLKSENIPLLNKVINIPFGESPFKAEVWFVNLTTKLDMKWGTTTPLQLEDPKYGIIVPVRAYGTYGLKVNEPVVFLKSLMGNSAIFTSTKVNEYFKGKLLSHLNNTLSKALVNEGTSVLEVNSRLLELSEFCQNEINVFFKKYGLSLEDFSFGSINVPANDPSVIKLKEAKDLQAKLKIVGRDNYQMDRSFNVLETAAGNEGNGGVMMSAGVGMGAGIGMGNTFGQMAANNMNIGYNQAPMQQAPPPPPVQMTYFVFINGQQMGGQTIQTLTQLVNQGSVNRDTLAWRNGLNSWVRISEIPELANLFSNMPPPIPPTSQIPPQF